MLAALLGLFFAFWTYHELNGGEMDIQEAVDAGRVWSVAEGRMVTLHEVLVAARGKKFVLLGEKHDNLEHHRLQLFVLSEIVRSGRSPALVMEQLDREYDEELSKEIARDGRTLESVLLAGHFDRKGWMYEGYAPLVDFALLNDLALVAGNFSRKSAWAMMNGTTGPTIPDVSPDTEKFLADMIFASHPGAELDENVVRGMVKAQRVRDFYLADALLKHGETGAVLIAGAGHTDLRHGVPLYLPERPLVIKFTEVDPSVTDPRLYVERDGRGVPQSDYIWFTHRSFEK